MNAYPRKEAGFALITSLLVMVVLSVLGAGAYFLTNMNLRIAENGRTGAIATYNAHEGLDLALLAIGQEYTARADFSWPTLAELKARLPGSSDFEITALDLDTPVDGISAGGMVTVVGFGPRNARYETGARFEGQLSEFSRPGPGEPAFGIGWVTDSDMEISGKTTFSIPLWAGGTIDGSGNAVNVLPVAKFVWAAGECKLKLGKSPLDCESGTESPNIPKFVFADELADLRLERPTCDLNVTTSSNLNATSYRNKTVCLADGVNLTVNGTAEGLYILGSEKTTVTFNGTAEGTADSIGVKIAVGRFTTSSGFTLNGMNTIFTVESIDFVSNSTYTNGTMSGSEHYVNTLLGTEGNVYVHKAEGKLDAIIWANGHFCKHGNGGLDFVGSILTKGLGPTSGKPCTPGIYWNGGGGGTFTAVGNEDIPTKDEDEAVDFSAAGILVVAKRP